MDRICPTGSKFFLLETFSMGENYFLLELAEILIEFSSMKLYTNSSKSSLFQQECAYNRSVPFTIHVEIGRAMGKESLWHIQTAKVQARSLAST